MAPAADLQAPDTTRTLAEPGGASGLVRRTVLPGGLRVVTEAVPTVRSAAFGVWVGVGSRDETDRTAGGSHFLEHLLFKGTRRRDALDIAAAMDSVGGEMNAFTEKEYTVYYARVLDVDLPLAMDLVSDMVTSSVIASSDVEVERGVILEEIAMHEDEPADIVHDLFAAAVFGTHPLGRPVIGTVDTIEAMGRTGIAGYYKRRYTAPATVVAAAGNLDHDEVVRRVAEAFAGVLGDASAVPAGLRSAGRVPAYSPQVSVVSRGSEQANVMLGTAGVGREDPRRFALGVLNNALGGGMSSRLFQEVREKRGLAYSVYSHANTYADSGMFGIYAGCAPSKAADVLALCREQLDAVVAGGITHDELVRGKGQLVGSLVLGLEDTGSRMSRIGKGELVHAELVGVEEIVARIQAVTLDDVRAVARDVLGQRLALAAVGPFADVDLSGSVA